MVIRFPSGAGRAQQGNQDPLSGRDRMVNALKRRYEKENDILQTRHPNRPTHLYNTAVAKTQTLNSTRFFPKCGTHFIKTRTKTFRTLQITPPQQTRLSSSPRIQVFPHLLPRPRVRREHPTTIAQLAE